MRRDYDGDWRAQFHVNDQLSMRAGGDPGVKRHDHYGMFGTQVPGEPEQMQPAGHDPNEHGPPQLAACDGGAK